MHSDDAQRLQPVASFHRERGNWQQAPPLFRKKVLNLINDSLFFLNRFCYWLIV